MKLFCRRAEALLHWMRSPSLSRRFYYRVSAFFLSGGQWTKKQDSCALSGGVTLWKGRGRLLQQSPQSRRPVSHTTEKGHTGAVGFSNTKLKTSQTLSSVRIVTMSVCLPLHFFVLIIFYLSVTLDIQCYISFQVYTPVITHYITY